MASLVEKLAVLNVLKDWASDVDTGFTAVDDQITAIAREDDPDFVALAQTLVAAGDMTLTGTDFACVRKVTLTASGDNSGVTFTVYGTDKDDAVINEAIVGPNAETVEGTLEFKTVTQIAADGATTGDVEAGIGEVSSYSIYDTYGNANTFRSSGIPAVTLSNALGSVQTEASA